MGMPIPSHFRPQPKFVQVKDRVPYWHFAPGDRVKLVKGDERVKGKVGVIERVERETNRVYLAEPEFAVRFSLITLHREATNSDREPFTDGTYPPARVRDRPRSGRRTSTRASKPNRPSTRPKTRTAPRARSTSRTCASKSAKAAKSTRRRASGGPRSGGTPSSASMSGSGWRSCPIWRARKRRGGGRCLGRKRRSRHSSRVSVAPQLVQRQPVSGLLATERFPVCASRGADLQTHS